MATLAEIYKSKGKALPPPSQRFNDPEFAAAAQKAGITKDQYLAAGSNNAAFNTKIASSYGGAPTEKTLPTGNQPVAPVSNQGMTLPTAPPQGLTLPQAPKSNLVAFADALDKTVSLARDKRIKFEKEFLGSKVTPGMLSASNFADVLQNIDVGGSRFAEQTSGRTFDAAKSDVESAQSEYQNQVKRYESEKSNIQQLALEAAKEGANKNVIDSILKAPDLNSAIGIASGSLAQNDKDVRIIQSGDKVYKVVINKDGTTTQEVLFGGSTPTSTNTEPALSKDQYIQKLQNERGQTLRPEVADQEYNKYIKTQTSSKPQPIQSLDDIKNLPVSDLTKAVMAGYAKTKDLTPTDRAEVVTEMYNVGFNPHNYVVEKLNNLVALYGAVPDNDKGPLEGFKTFYTAKTTPSVSTFESAKQVLTREIARLNDVGVLSDQDVQSYSDAMPSLRDKDLSVVLAHIKGLAQTITGQKFEHVGETVQLKNGKTAIVGPDGDTLLDPQTGRPIE